MSAPAAPHRPATMTEQDLAEAESWVKVGRALAIEKCPYLDLALSSMIPVAVPGLGTAATDVRWRFYYDPVRIMALPEADRRRVMVSDWIHEIGHQLRDHAQRWKQLGAEESLHPVWNIAGDALINKDLDDLDLLLLPTDVRIEELPGGIEHTMTTEQIYAILLREWPRRVPGAAASPDCGSGSGGGRRDWELSPDDPDSNPGGGAADGSVDGVRADLIRQETAEQVRTYAKAQGSESLPHGLREWADGYLEPIVDWRRELRSAVSRALGRAAGRFDYSWTRPPRRRIPGYTTPGMVAPEPPTAAVVVDTSGSMSPDDLAQAIADISALTRSVAGSATGKAPVRVIPCDATAGEVQIVRNQADIRSLKLTGGGGTDMPVGLDKAAHLRPRPQVVVTITDGYTPWPEEPPSTLSGIPFIAVIVEPDLPVESRPAGDPPDWMHTIRARA